MSGWTPMASPGAVKSPTVPRASATTSTRRSGSQKATSFQTRFQTMLIELTALAMSAELHP